MEVVRVEEKEPIVLEIPRRRNIALRGELLSAIDEGDKSVRIYRTRSGRVVLYERDWPRGEAEVHVFGSLEELAEIVGWKPMVIEAIKRVRPELVTDYIE